MNTLYAILETGGKQYNVKVGDTIRVEKLPVNVGESITLDTVLLYANDDNVQVGKPYVSGISVNAHVLEQNRAKKVIVYKYKAKKGYHRKRGHRQPFTKLRIEAINA